MSEFKNLGVIEIVELLKTGKTTQEEVWNYFQNRIEEKDGDIQAFNYVHKDFKKADTSTSFAGLPYAVKDLYNESGRPTTASSKMLDGYISPYESTVTKLLKNHGAQSIGKVNCDEFAMGTTGENSAIRTTKNPWDITRVPGGSSSGSVASVAAGMIPFALGTDTGGSIRQPAGLSGVVGFKGTYGRASRYGVIPMASSFDTMGVITRSVRDAEFVWSHMIGLDPMDATSLNETWDSGSIAWSKTDLKGVKIGIPKEYFIDGLDTTTRKEVANTIESLKQMGAEVIDISLALTQYAIAAYYVLVPSEASTNLGRFDGIRFGHTTAESYENYAEFISKSRAEGFGPEPLRRIMIGTHALSAGFYDAYYKKASLVRQMVRDEFAQAFTDVDVIISPVSPRVAWKIGELADDPLALYLADIFTIPGALAGLPGLTLPCGFGPADDDAESILPVGLQIMGPQLGEAKVFEVGNIIEKALSEKISGRVPQVF